MVEITSSPPESPWTKASPRAMAFRIKERWEMDLSPGTERTPPKEAGRLMPREGLDGGAVLMI
jgi:hypothetical protein